MIKAFVTLFLTIFSLTSYGAELFEIPLSKQLSESNAIIMGVYQDSYVKKLNNGKIVTNVTFKLEKSVGLGNRKQLSKNSFNFVYNGGQWQGINYPNENMPRFVKGRRYIVLLVKGEQEFYPFYDRLGVYTVIGREGEEEVVSQAFPANDTFGANSLSTFSLWVSTVFGESLEGLGSDKDIYKNKKSGRRIASINEEKSKNTAYKIPVYWLVIIFGLLGAAHLRKTKA
ncbi:MULTISPECIES: hypothetical protein [Halobacteriovorax]|uniref:Uncharacterized protein n=1 Tax=Halobacteriovorax vibrionivorans TaxID=2152716 RepID=A0ABY0IJQ6_9BACT|nr:MULTISPECIES: hypothetical protein [Halobacteriovorax]AYF43186.1 hypothetical protein BALOs_0165 [Halobacteriovorax sp. BALOs_7]RZF23203.1 hypothetical protein DAY19_05385 [Halobacteriovorax vibrionivorans]TGD46356.1 hypothetical protein EP118_12385 [Halobacteriovorax sp. Y22]